ncbi:hypothetical protein CMI44_01810 [Candidatus Pacearchaeota archaeon]|nr:hypothetical protein [Candidatus Pacearchaeota archaeon]
MDVQIWLLILVAVMIVILAVLAIFTTRRRKRPIDYCSFFIMGVIWFAVGILFKNYILFTVGLIFTIVGLVHKKNWKKNRLRWSDLDKKEKKWRIILMIALGGILLIGALALFLVSKRII